MQQDFPIVEDHRVVGVLMRSDLLRALASRGQAVPVADVMQREFQVVDSSDMLEPALARLETCECHALPVTHRGRLVGLVTMDNIGEFVMVQAATRAA